jgi:hypothetical protein
MNQIKIILQNSNKIILFIAFFLLITLVSYHFKILTFPYQLEYREVVPLLITQALDKGILPYNIKHQPYYADLYGILYPLVALPLTKVFGLNLFTYRLISMISIFGSGLYLFKTLLNQKLNLTASILLCILYYSFCLFQYTPICRQDSLGLFMFTLIILIPYNNKFSQKSLLLSAIISVLAFHTKIYFFIGFPIILTYLFLFSSIKKSLKLFGIYILMFLFVFLINSYLFDYYYIGTFFNQLVSTSYDIFHMINQTYFFFLIAIPIITSILVLVFVCEYMLKKKQLINLMLNIYLNKKNQSVINYKNLNIGFLNISKISYFHYLFFTFLTLLSFKMGGHNGNFLLYYIHLLSIPIILLISEYINKTNKILLLNNILILLSIFVFMKNIPTKNDLKLVTKNFNKLETIIRNTKGNLNNPVISSINLKYGEKIYNSGLTETFISGDKFRYSENYVKPIAILKDKIYLKTINKIIPKNKKYITKIKNNIINHKFKVIFSDISAYDDWIVSDVFLKNNKYHPIDTVKINMFATYQKWTIIVWKLNKN